MIRSGVTMAGAGAGAGASALHRGEQQLLCVGSQFNNDVGDVDELLELEDWMFL